MTNNTGELSNGGIRVEAGSHGVSDKSINTIQDRNSKVVDKGSRVHSLARLAWNWICWSGIRAFDGMDFAGEVLANFLGLTHSKYQWIIDAQEHEEQEKQHRRVIKRQRRQLCLEQLLKAEQRKLEELEIGAREQDAELRGTTFAMH